MNQRLSNKISIATTLCCFMIVLRHSLNLEAFYNNTGYPQWLFFIEMGVTRMTDIAVPFFFIVSGFFFSRYNYYQQGNYSRMASKKIRTLLIPFLFWNLIGAIALLVYDKNNNLGSSPQECLVNFITSQWYGPLWYVRDLMIFMIMVPLYGWIYNLKNNIVYILLLTVLFFLWEPGTSNLLSTEGVFCFALGGFVYLNNDILNRKANIWFVYFFIAIWLMTSFFVSTWSNTYIHRISILWGVVAFWMFIGIVHETYCKQFLRLAKYSFLIYVTHFNLEKILKFIVSRLWYSNEYIAILSYFLIPIVIIYILAKVGKIMVKKYPVGYKIVMGNR